MANDTENAVDWDSFSKLAGFAGGLAAGLSKVYPSPILKYVGPYGLDVVSSLAGVAIQDGDPDNVARHTGIEISSMLGGLAGTAVGSWLATGALATPAFILGTPVVIPSLLGVAITAGIVWGASTLSANVENMVYTGAVAFTGTGNSLNNAISGGAAADTLYGGAGDDSLDGKAGADVMYGGQGDDTYIVDNAADVTNENAGEGVDTINTALATFSLASRANIENLTYTGSVAFTGTGNELNNIIIGSFFAANILDGGAGADMLQGGFANDTYIVDNVGDIIVEQVGVSVDLIKTSLNNYSLMQAANVENLTFTGTGNFNGTGNEAKNTITGGTGNDLLDGGFGADTLVGGLGDDVYIVDNAGDVVSEAANGGTDEIRTSLATQSIAALTYVEDLTYTGSANFTGTGNAAANRIKGGTGNDLLNGGAGADTLIGGQGNDTYVVDNVGDVVTEVTGEGIDTVQTALTSYTLGVNVENLVSTGTAAFTGAGNDLDNLIVGGAGSNTLTGGGGNDILVGGAAADFFVYAPGFGQDTIVNFVAAGTAHDTIKIDHSVFADWASLLAASSQAGSDTIITVDNNNTITLKNVAVSSLQSADFQFT